MVSRVVPLLAVSLGGTSRSPAARAHLCDWSVRVSNSASLSSPDLGLAHVLATADVPSSGWVVACSRGVKQLWDE